jgi:hypothetical protein
MLAGNGPMLMQVTCTILLVSVETRQPRAVKIFTLVVECGIRVLLCEPPVRASPLLSAIWIDAAVFWV